MASCVVCDEEVPDNSIKCRHGCSLHFECAPLKEATWKKKANKEEYECPVCRDKSKEQSPVSAKEMRKFMRSVTLKLNTIDDVKAQLTTIEELKQSVSFLSDKFDTAISDLEDSKKQIRELETKVERLSAENASKDGLVTNLQVRVRELEQYNRNRNIEITGVTESDEEDLRMVMHNIANIIRVPYKDEDVDVVHRVPSRDKEVPSKIIAQFSSRRVRDTWMEKKRNVTIMVQDILPSTMNSQKVYLNTHLCAEWKSLLWKAKQCGRPKGYQAIWYRNGKIMAKKNFNDKNVILIYSEMDLEKLV